ncbi:MAG: L,D-transpeptidase [Hyphomicrobium sp.]
MTFRARMNSFAYAAVAALAVALSPHSASAQGFDFLWGGTEEFGGGRGIVSFNPQFKAGEIIVSFSDRRLYLITKPGQAITYPVAVPTGEARWQGKTYVSNKRVNPPWTPTPEMVAKNPRLPRWVPGGHPMNPLGVRALYLGSSAYRIHGTDAPWTIGQAVSHGCIRMLNQDVLDLYPRVPVGTRVTVTWQHFNTSSASNSSSPSSSKSASSSSSSGGSLSDLFFYDDEPAKQPASRKSYRSSVQRSAAAE